MKTFLTWLVILGVLGGGGYAAWRRYDAKSEKPLQFRTAKVEKGDISQQVTANGGINPVKNVAVGTQVSGIIQAMYVDFNSHVTNGQLLAEIDPSTYKQNILSSEADLASAQAALEYAQINHKRSKQLAAAKLIAQGDYDKTVADLHQAEASVQTRSAALNRAKVDLERTQIYAPIDGVVISRQVDVGQTVAASLNTPTLFQIANDLRKMQIEAMVSEADVGGVLEGQKVTFNVDAFQGRSFTGSIRQVRFNPITNQNVVNYTTVVDVNNDDLKLRPGMTAYASIILAQRTGILRVPSGALSFRPPTNAIVVGLTNIAGAKTNRADRPAGGPGMAGGGGGDREEMRKRFEAMSPEEREKMRAQMRERFGGGGGGGFGGGGFGGGGGMGGRPRPEGPVTRTAYILEKEAKEPDEQPVLRAVSVKAGISDGTYTEIVDGLKEGDVLVSGVVVTTPPAAAATPAGRSPFAGGGGGGFGGGGFGGGGGPRR